MGSAILCVCLWKRVPFDLNEGYSHEVIDLTGDDLAVITAAGNDFDIIDLTEVEETMVSPVHGNGYIALDLKHSTPVSMQPACSPKMFSTVDSGNKFDVPISLWNTECEQAFPKEDAVKQTCFQNGFSLVPNYGGDSESNSLTSYNSDMSSFGSPLLGSDIFSLSSPSSSEHQTDCVEEAPSCCPPERGPNPQLSPSHQRCSPSPISCYSPLNIAPSLAEAEQPLLEAHNPTPGVQEQTEWGDIKAWVKTLQYFQGVPVHHPFLQNAVQERDAKQNKPLKPQPIPNRRLRMVSSTIEENFFQGTLDFLTGYVSCRYYPPMEITSCVVRQILLGPEQQEGQQEIQKDAYMLLMKIQALHPAKTDTVVWDWQLLHEVMEEQVERFPGRLLFLQYVIQTLEDDFQRTVRLGILPRSIAKAVLSCDQCFSNVKEVTEWLVAAITAGKLSQHRRPLQKARSPLLETSTDKSSTSVPKLHLDQTADTDDAALGLQSQKEVALLQRMLFIAVEVDKSPNCSASKMADMVFSAVLNIPKRCQREAFLNSMECHILRCKVLELIFHHSCTEPTNLPLSMAKILYFLNNFSLLLKYQDSEETWQGWDEMLHHLNLLLLSYRTMVLGHLRSSVCERINLINKAAKPKLQPHDYISSSDAEYNIKSFQEKLSETLGQPLPLPIKEKTELFKVLLLTFIDNKPENH
ncbi:SUMO-interacting motif-containing protein 1 isoform X2 [Hemicordylus capensis]|uniref:SUMO-interacting motif-containing protein 1 isoform X2 n=1 Tax=Hemicordylus capensis TaxID=884348 RepID=UPI0023045C2D|nr:SUMO-interacting motif-containing protein 1 isoform X2 [Hemicordylus capensis]